MSKYLTILGGVVAEIWDSSTGPSALRCGLHADFTGMTVNDALEWALDQRVVPAGAFVFDSEVECPIRDTVTTSSSDECTLIWVEVLDSGAWDVFSRPHPQQDMAPLLTMCQPERL